ncbi:hypothetical protein FJTKL_05181 [Diaporthe vaccinii]|uniref:Uncharacterized protein n=1 Tax=Diaporthe vaccinii TaxID=105482 RepID=A0ABR4FFG6_9PEZI
MVTDHSGFDEVYWLALSSTALLVSQLPRAALLPTILMVSPYVVVTSSSNVTRTEEAIVQPVEVGAAPVVVAVEVRACPGDDIARGSDPRRGDGAGPTGGRAQERGRSIGCGVGCNDVHVAIGIRGNGVDQCCVRRRAGLVCASSDGRVEILEEGQRCRCDFDRPLGLPYNQSIVELLCCSKCGQIPGVAVVVDIFGVSTDSDCSALRDSRVDAVNGTE